MKRVVISVKQCVVQPRRLCMKVLKSSVYGQMNPITFSLVHK